MRIPSGTTDQYIYFVAVDVTDLKTPETGLTTFTVYRSRDGAAAAAFTTPTVNETDATNMPGVYELLLDEDMTIAAGNDSEEMAFHIDHASMAPVVRVIELYRPKATVGNTLDVTATGAAGIDWGNIENKTTANDLSATDIQLVDTVTTYTGNTVQTGDTYALANGATGFAAIDTVVDAVKVTTDKFAFTVANQVDANALSVGGTTQTAGDVPALVVTADAAIDAVATTIGAAGAGLTAINLPNQTMDITGNLSGSVGSVTGAVGSVTAETTADVTKINGSATAAVNLGASALGIQTGAFEGTPSTTVMQTDLAEATDDHFIGRVLVITSGAGAQEATDITDYVGATGTLTVTAVTTAPAAADTFVIV